MERKRKGREREKSAASSQSVARRRHSGMSPCIGSAPLRSFKETAANPTNRAAKLTRIRSVLPTDLPPNLICKSDITRVCLIDQNQSEQLSNTTFCKVMCLLLKINWIHFYKVLILLKNPSYVDRIALREYQCTGFLFPSKNRFNQFMRPQRLIVARAYCIGA